MIETSNIIAGAEALKLDPIVDGDSCFTDTHIFEDECYIVKAVAQVHFIVIDTGTGKQVKEHINFALVAVDDSDKMTFVKTTIED